MLLEVPAHISCSFPLLPCATENVNQQLSLLAQSLWCFIHLPCFIWNIQAHWAVRKSGTIYYKFFKLLLLSTYTSLCHCLIYFLSEETCTFLFGKDDTASHSQCDHSVHAECLQKGFGALLHQNSKGFLCISMNMFLMCHIDNQVCSKSAHKIWGEIWVFWGKKPTKNQ